MKDLAEKIPSWIERLLLPRLSEITGEIKALSAKIESMEKTLNERITSLRSEMIAKFDSIEKTMNYRFEAVNTRIDSLEKRIPVMEEITAIKIRLSELEKRAQSRQTSSDY